jgi:diguanylate cyclase (GGDEF)-like protein/PAS domain S-box-containing protein
MTDRNTLLETALDSMPDGVVIFDREDCVAFWSGAAEAITGYTAAELHCNALPSSLKQLLLESAPHSGLQLTNAVRQIHGTQVHARHKSGHEFPVIIRTLTLHDNAGEIIGRTVLFHPVDRLDALPHGEIGEDLAIVSCRTEFEERLHAEYEDFERGGQPLGIYWILVDQAQDLHKTHGVAACHAMLDKVQHALASGLRPGEELARWGEGEFLVLIRERTSEMLTRHARTLASLARTAEFRWWGDRVSLTVSVGAAQANRRQSLQTLLERAREAMERSLREGGNGVTCAPAENNHEDAPGEEPICTPS